MSRYWRFDENNCTFVACSKQETFDPECSPGVYRDDDVYIVDEDGQVARWPSGEPLLVAGVIFNRENFES